MNGQVERYNRTVLHCLSARVEDERLWDREIEVVQWSLNNTLNKSTAAMPSQLLLGYQPRNKVRAKLLNEVAGSKIKESRKALRKRAAEKIVVQQAYNKRKYDLRRAPPKIYKKGDAVGVLREAPSDGESRKLKDNYAGPYEIEKLYSIKIDTKSVMLKELNDRKSHIQEYSPARC